MEPAGTAGPERRFRPEIEGLRAVAAVLVAVYHVFLGRVSGGVDVFFVIAGFLITTSLLGQVASTGRVDAGRYLSRLAARLLPIALFVLVVITIATVLWMPSTRQDSTYGEITASALSVENWALAIKAVDYLARETARSPVQHFWALSVQGQFYVAWLVLFGVAAVIADRARLPRIIGAALAVIFVVSLALSILLTDRNQAFAYFHTGTRMWEFAAGGLVAVLASRISLADGRLGRWSEPLGTLGGWVGLALIVSCGLVLQVSSEFPGYAALWPVAGAVLILVAGNGQRWGAGRLLSSRPFVFTGGVAFALYLWHWPLLTAYQAARETTGPVGLRAGTAILVASFVLAVVTTRLLERPVRARLSRHPRPWRVVAAATTAVLVVAVGASMLRTGSYATANEPLDPRDYPGAAAMVPGFVYDGDATGYLPDLRAISRDVTGLHGGCMQYRNDEELVTCATGDPAGERTVYLIGGSHATSLYPALEIVAQERGWRLLSATKAACRFQARPHADTETGRACRAWNEQLMAELLRERPDMVITTSTVNTLDAEWVPKGYLEHWRTLEAAGIPIIGIRDTPRAGFNRPDCLARHPDDPGACATPRSPNLDPVDPASLVEDLPSNVRLVDVTDSVCTRDECPAVVGNVVVFRDKHHLTASFARTLAPMISAQIPLEPWATP